MDAAIELAQHFKAELWVLHVVALAPSLTTEMIAMPYDVEQSDRARCQKALRHVDEIIASRVPPEVPTHSEVKMGHAPNEIGCLASDATISLIVIATHGRTGWRHLVFGSVAEAVVRSASCPVLTIQVKAGTLPAPVAVVPVAAVPERELEPQGVEHNG